MQGLADGYFVLPYTLANYLADGAVRAGRRRPPAVVEAQQAVEERIEKLLSINGTRTVDSFHRELGQIMWDYCGMERTEEGLSKAIEHDPRPQGRVLEQRQGHRRQRGAQPDARAGRPRGRLPRARRADVHRRAATAASPAAVTSATRARPRTARRCVTTTSSPTSRPGSTAEQRSRSCTRKPLEYEYVEMKAQELQVKITVRVWRQKNADAKGKMVTLRRSRTSASTCRSSRCSTSSTSSSRWRARSRSRSTTTAARASAARAAS